MTDVTELEQQLTEALADRAAAASPPDDGWDRIMSRLLDDSAVQRDYDGIGDMAPDEPRARRESIRHILGRPLAVIGVAAAAVILAVVLLSLVREDATEEIIFTDDTEAPDPDASDTGALQSVSAVPVGPGAWSVAASFTGSVDAEVVAGVLDEMQTWPGVVSVATASTPDEWQTLTGFDWGCGAGDSGPGCGTGVLAWVVNSQMTRTALRLESELGMAAVTVDDRPGDFFQGYLDAAVDIASPVPLDFDPGELGTEQPLRNLAENEFGEFCDAPGVCAVAVAVDVGGFVIRAGISLPAADDDFPELGILEGEGGGRGLAISDFLVDAGGEGGAIVVMRSFGGRKVYTVAGLPLEAAVVTTVLVDGTEVWQRPIGGMILIVDQPGTAQSEPAVEADEPLVPFTVLDANGVEMMHIEGTANSPIVTDLRIDSDSLSGSEAGPAAGAVASDIEVVVTDVVDGLGWAWREMVTTGDAIWGIDSDSGVLFRIDAGTRQVTGTVPVGDGGPLLATTDAVWVGLDSGNMVGATLLRIDRDTLTVTDEVEVVGGVQAAYEIDGDIWVVPFDIDASITQIAPETSAEGSTSWKVAATYPAAPGSTWWSALIEDTIWGAYGDQSLVWRFDPASGQMTDQIPTGFAGTTEEGAVVSHDAIWLIHHAGTAIRVDRTTREVTDTLRVGASLRTGVATDDALWLPNVRRGTITRVDLDSREITDVIDVGGAGRPLATDTAIWVPSWDSGTVSRVDIESRSITHTIEVGMGAQTPFEFDGAIWVPSLEAGTLTRIEVS